MTDPNTTPTTGLTRLADAATGKVRAWLTAARPEGRETAAGTGAARRLAAVLSDPQGLDFAVGFVDRVVRTEDPDAAARALADLGEITPKTLSLLDRAQIRAGAALATTLPRVVVPVAKSRIRSMVGHMVVDAEDRPLGRAVATLTAGGHRLNINLLGEAVLGEDEADHHLAETRRLLARDDIDYVSVKASSVASQINMWGYRDTVDYVVDRLTPLYLEAAKAPAGSKFINLDMEEYRDLKLTVAVFRRLMSLPETKHLEAGIVLQAYLPDALAAMEELAAFGARRVDAGGAGIKVRLVKGANLAMETVHAEMQGWPLVTCPSKEATDANYKLVLHRTLTRDSLRGLRLGVAGHNLFDIAFAHLLSVERGVSDKVEFEMLQGMAGDQAGAVSRDVGQLLLYVPAVRPSEFDVAVSYLVRRLEENSAPTNFMSGIFRIAPDNDVFRREERRFRSSLADLAVLLQEQGGTPPAPNRRQDRSSEVLPETSYLDTPLPGFRSEPDTDPSLTANQDWAAAAVARSAEPGFLDQLSSPESVTEADIDPLVASVTAAAGRWAARPAHERAAVLYRAADILASRRGHLVSVAAAEVGKSVAQSDTEISEAVDFARYYAHSAEDLDRVRHARFTPDKVVLVTPPWNFPLAIPAGGTFAALAAGAGVIHKPSKPSPHCSMAVLEALWDAGVPRDLLRGVYPAERATGRTLVSHPGISRVILTGSSDTAAMFSSWRPGLRINGETSGKNAIIVTPSADRDLAVADLVSSAFGHAGQKCSAASLGILVGSVADSERFLRQLVDATSSLTVDWPTNLRATTGPLTELPSDKLTRALTTLEDGEEWLVTPRQLDGTGRLWSPGIRTNVQPGSFFHLTEVFGPVLGLMRADTLEDALDLQNATEFGLTGGIHSLDVAEVRRWLDKVRVGNAYVNRGITGAIVRRQPFGGWKKSSVGLGSKAGGPNYVMLMGTWSDDAGAPDPGTGPGDGTGVTGGRVTGDVSGAVDAFLTALGRSASVDDADLAWLTTAALDDRDTWNTEFGTPRDVTGLHSEANIFRYLPTEVVLRVSADATAVEVARTLAAARRAAAPVQVLADPAVDPRVTEVLATATDTLGTPPARTVDDATFTSLLLFDALGDEPARVRFVGRVAHTTLEELAGRPDVTVLDDAVTASGRVELRYWLKEQSLAVTLHRFGNPSPDFHALAEELTGQGRLRS